MADNQLRVNTVHDYNAYVGAKDSHPLISVIDYAEVSPIRHSRSHFNVFGLFLRDEVLEDLSYGCGKYDYREGTLISVAPGQIGGMEDNGQLFDIKGWAILFHPDLLHGTPLNEKIKEYSFFSYSVNEALHMTLQERETLDRCFALIKAETERCHASYQNEIIVGMLDVILNYCMRFYDRQFLTRGISNNDTMARLERFLNDYYDTGRQLTEGLPSVVTCASELCMSANYFSDLLKRQTGETVSNHIRRFVIERAKSKFRSGDSVNHVSYDLGFEYPQHFSRMFKNYTGCTPTEYIKRLKGSK